MITVQAEMKKRNVKKQSANIRSGTFIAYNKPLWLFFCRIRLTWL